MHNFRTCKQTSRCEEKPHFGPFMTGKIIGGGGNCPPCPPPLPCSYDPVLRCVLTPRQAFFMGFVFQLTLTHGLLTHNCPAIFPLADCSAVPMPVKIKISSVNTRLDWVELEPGDTMCEVFILIIFQNHKNCIFTDSWPFNSLSPSAVFLRQ